MYNPTQRLIRSRTDKIIAGVAGGKGSLAANKLWLADNVQQVSVTANPDVEVTEVEVGTDGVSFLSLIHI